MSSNRRCQVIESVKLPDSITWKGWNLSYLFKLADEIRIGDKFFWFVSSHLFHDDASSRMCEWRW